jgi:hypothetical protein
MLKNILFLSLLDYLALSLKARYLIGRPITMGCNPDTMRQARVLRARRKKKMKFRRRR